MKHELVRVTGFNIVKPYTLRISFDDATEKTIDFEPVLYGAHFAPLRDPEFFERVRLDHEIHTLVWPNDAAFDPATLHSWDAGEGEELARRAQEWKVKEST